MRQTNFLLKFNASRSFGGYEELTGSADVSTWKAIADHYSEVLFAPDTRLACQIDIDWSSGIEYAQRCETFSLLPPEQMAQALAEDPTFFDRRPCCPVTVTFPESATELPSWSGIEQVTHLMYEIFLIANISTPGAFNLYRSFLHVDGGTAETEDSPFAVTDLELSELFFEDAWLRTRSASWGRIGFLPFANTLEWYRAQSTGANQVARTKLQKALFSLLHIAKRSSMEPETSLWIAGLLEELFDTNTGSSFQQLNTRVSKFLALSDGDAAFVKKQLREFFNIRHGFAHGGSPIAHPIANEVLDPSVDAVFGKTMEANGFGGALLLSVIQEIVRRGLLDLRYEDNLVEIKVKP